MPFENENQFLAIGCRDGSNGCRMRLANSKCRNGKEYMRTRAPFLDCLTLNADFGHTPFENCQGGSPGSDVVPRISGRPYYAIQEVKSYRDVNVNPGVKRCTWEVHHDGDDESEKRDNMLNNEKFVGEVPNWRCCADIHPNQNCIHCPAGRNT
jgi:hypothetical protein